MPVLSLHPLVQRDLSQILDYYQLEGGEKLADRFFTEAQRLIERIEANPEQFHFIDDHYSRANLNTFPHHFIFEVTPRGPRITVLRHHKRHPRYGRQRK